MLPGPLRDFPIVASRNPADLINSARRLYHGSISPVGPFVDGDHVLRGFGTPDFSIGYIASDLQVRVTADPTVNSYFVNFGVVGQLIAARQDQYANLSKWEATVFNPGDAQELRPKTRGPGLLGLRIDAGFIQRELDALVGHPLEAPVRFDLRLDLTRPKGRAVGLLVSSLVEQLDSGDPLFLRPSVQRAQMRSIVTALLLAQPHSYTNELGDEQKPIHPRVARRAVMFIDANLTNHITLGDIAQAAGCSARTLGNMFRRHFGVPPMTYVRNARLDRIHAEIRSSDSSVGAIAYRWGVSHLGRFANDYRARFGELPSSTASRR